MRSLFKILGYNLMVSPALWVYENYLPQPSYEPVYMHLFHRELTVLGISDRFTPVGGASSYSLLFHLVRLVRVMGNCRVLELGAGQSTLLFSDLKKIGLISSLHTLEHDQAWAGRIENKAESCVTYASLSEQFIDGRQTTTYQHELSFQDIDLLLVDGPLGQSSFSRLGALNHLKSLNSSRFAVIFDDTHRWGEKQTLKRAREILKEKHGPVGEVTIRSAKHSTILFAGFDIADLYLSD